MSFRDLFINIVNFLRTNLTDPLNRGTDWIYFVGPTVPVTYPLITISPAAGGTRDAVGIGAKGSRFTVLFDIEIFTDSTTEAIIDTASYIGNDLLSYLSDQIIKLFINKRREFGANYNVLDIYTGPIRVFPYDETIDQYRVLIPITIQLEVL